MEKNIIAAYFREAESKAYGAAVMRSIVMGVAPGGGVTSKIFFVHLSFIKESATKSIAM